MTSVPKGGFKFGAMSTLGSGEYPSSLATQFLAYESMNGS